MAKNREMLKEAIAEAKAVKEMAIANAKAALEEAFTPQLKSMLSLKLQEMELEEDEIEEVGFGKTSADPEEGFSAGFNEKALDEDEYKTRNVFIILLEILIEIIFVGISAFYCNIIISKLGMPFDISLSRASGIDANGPIIISFIMMFFQTNLKMKLKFLYENIFKKKHIMYANSGI